MPGSDDIQYSDRYYDTEYEYRHVILPPDISRLVPRTHLLTETEWRNLGVQQSPGWMHYMLHNPEPHVLLFRRPKPKDEPVIKKEPDQNLCSQKTQQSQDSRVKASDNENSQPISTVSSTNAVLCV